jgi:hypothetical protein
MLACAVGSLSYRLRPAQPDDLAALQALWRELDPRRLRKRLV